MILVEDRTVAWFGSFKMLMMKALEVTIIITIMAFVVSKFITEPENPPLAFKADVGLYRR